MNPQMRQFLAELCECAKLRLAYQAAYIQYIKKLHRVVKQLELADSSFARKTQRQKEIEIVSKYLTVMTNAKKGVGKEKTNA